MSLIGLVPVGSKASSLLTAGRSGVLSVDDVRAYAEAGVLAKMAEDPAERRKLYPAVADITWPLVWTRHTRRLEMGKGHHSCAASLDMLAPECIDGFHDDVESVVEHVLRQARTPIHSLEGWISSRITVATVDGFRRRRGMRGALQRVRVPRWLSAALADDPWLVELAARIIEWVGVPTTFYGEPWPIPAWVELHSATFGVVRTPEAVTADVERVLAVMRKCRPQWYAAYVESPLGHKVLPVAIAEQIDQQADKAGPEAEETALAEVAAVALDAITTGLAAGRDPSELVIAVLRTLFVDGGPADYPGTDDRDRWLAAVLDSPPSVARLVDDVLEILCNPTTSVS